MVIWKLGKLYLLLATVGVHLVLYGIMLTGVDRSDNQLTWILVTIPFADAGVLGFWLVAGSSRAWLRLMASIVGLCSILAIMVQAMQIYPFVLATALSSTMSLTAIGTLLLGCVAGYLPGWQGWRVKFALWEIMAATCLVGTSLAVLQMVVSDVPFQWREWWRDEGGEFLIFSVVSGFVLAVAGLPILSSGRRVRIVSVIVMCVLLGMMPIVERVLFGWLVGGKPNSGFLFVVHLLQAGFAWGTLIPLRATFPGFVASLEAEAVAEDAENSSETPSNVVVPADDFLKMQ